MSESKPTLRGRLDALPDDLTSLTDHVAVGRVLALTLSSLAERAARAERDVRAASWDQPDGIEARISQADDADREEASAVHALIAGEVQPAGPYVDPHELNPEAELAAHEAEVAVRDAYQAVAKAHHSVLAAQLASAQQQAEEADRRRRRLRIPPSVSSQRGALSGAVRAEMVYQLHRKPRKLMRATAFAILSGAIYLAFIRIFQWNTYGRWAPYLAVLFISSVMATSACFNSFCFDARRVRVALDQGARLWQILLVKNLVLMGLVFPLGLIMSLVLAFLTGKPATLLASIGLVLCMLFLWGGVGNLLTIVVPIRDAPLKVHKQEGTLKAFVVEFGVTWAASSVVLFMLMWRVYSAQGMGQRYGSTIIAVLLLLGSGILAWINLTVIATAFANSPTVYRRLRRELDWEHVG